MINDGAMYDYARTSNYFTPMTQGGEPIAPNAASIRVLVPDANAKVLFDGAPTQQMGNDRWFHTPPLQTGTARYRIRATWMQGGREMSQDRDVQVAPGRVSVVRFDMNTTEQVPGAQRSTNPTPQDQILEGKILKTEQDHFILETRDNRQVTIYTSPQTRYTLNQNPAAFSDIRVGNSVNVNYTRLGDRHNATAITIRP